MIVGYEDRPFHMYEENDKYRHNEFDSCIEATQSGIWYQPTVIYNCVFACYNKRFVKQTKI